MPLRDDILNPLPGDKPAGENLRYAPVFDKIKEARRQEEDTGDQGEWKRELKAADFIQVVKLASEVIATKSKDLQVAAWLTEAMLNREGYAGLAQGLQLIKDLIERFWDGLYPELEDGEAELRAAPIDWVGTYLAIPCKKVPLTKSGFDYLKYLEAKAVGNEPGYEDSDSRKEAYQQAISEGKLPMADFEKAIANTPKEFYEKTVESMDLCLQVIEESQPVFEEKFGEFVPSYGRLRDALEEVRRITNGFLQKKIEAEGPAAEPEPAQEEAAAETDTSWWDTPADATAAAAAPKPKKARAVTSAEPADKDDAALRLAAVAAWWRREDAYNPAPYLMLRGYRWGELRASIPPDASTFEAPPTEVRQNLKRLLGEGSYAEVIELAENTMAEPCGRAWLDLQRYAVTALENQGYSAIADAIKAELKTLVRDCPDLLTASLLDDTPTANNETLAWLKTFTEPEPAAAPAASWEPPPAMEEPSDGAEPGAPAPPDAFQLAMEAARGGRTEDAIGILADEIAHQTSGRGRFQRKLQLAQVCLSTGQQVIAHSLLEELAESIDRHQLEGWESPDVVAHALSLLYACVERTELDQAQKAKLYARICRLDPVQALKHHAQAFAHGR